MSQPKTGQDSASTDHLIREWLFRFGLNFGKDVVPLLPLWQEQLGGIEPDVLQHIFQNAIRTCKFFPTIAELRGQIEKADTAGLALEAAEAWDRYLAHLRRFFHPDIGWNRRAPHLDAITEHAARAAGGERWIESCPEEKLQWCQNAFIEDYTLAHETCQVQNLLTRVEAKKILKSLTSQAPTKRLSPPHEPTVASPESSEPDHETLRALNDVFEEIKAPKPRLVPPSEEELERRKKAQRDALDRYISEHPELAVNPKPKEELQPAEVLA